MRARSKDAKKRRLRKRGTQGAVAVEYAFLLISVFIPTAAGSVAGGIIALNDYVLSRGWILQNVP